MENLQLIQGYICLKEGSSVAQQFEDTFDGEQGFKQQNQNAMKYILTRCKEVRDAELLKDDEELREYIATLEDYFND